MICRSQSRLTCGMAVPSDVTNSPPMPSDHQEWIKHSALWGWMNAVMGLLNGRMGLVCVARTVTSVPGGEQQQRHVHADQESAQADGPRRLVVPRGDAVRVFFLRGGVSSCCCVARVTVMIFVVDEVGSTYPPRHVSSSTYSLPGPSSVSLFLALPAAACWVVTPSLPCTPQWGAAAPPRHCRCVPGSLQYGMATAL